jgi:hypothetical protein
MDLSVILGLIASFAQKYPLFTAVVGVMGTARLILKPIIACIKALVEQSESKKDDEKLAKIEGHKVYKAVMFILDWALSIKPIKK